MKKFDASTLRQIDHMNVELADAHSSLSDAITAYNKAVADAFSDLRSEIDTYNDVVETVIEACAPIYASMDDYYEGKTDAWCKSKAGIDFANWKDEWNDLELETVDFGEPDDLDEPELPVLTGRLSVEG